MSYVEPEPNMDRRAFLSSVTGAAVGAGAALILPPTRTATSPDGTLEVFNVKDYGAVGNGTTNDASAVQATINAAVAAPYGGTIYFPPGNYLIQPSPSFPLVISNPNFKRLAMVGNGWSSNILWAFNNHLFYWPYSCREVTIRDLTITSWAVNKSPQFAAFNCNGGIERTVFDHVNVIYDFSNPTPTNLPGSGILCNPTAFFAGCAIYECLFFGIQGTGIRLGNGAEVRIIGGRVIGTRLSPSYPNYTPGSIGIQFTGDNGGVHIVSTDVYGLEQGVRIENSSGLGSNREIFITDATLDSCWRALEIRDSSIVSVTGCGLGSSDQEIVHVEVDAGSKLMISGGYIYNAGAWVQAGANGITVNSGSFILDGVWVSYNRGRGIWVPNSSVSEYTITGCRIMDNGQPISLDGSWYIVANNVFARNNGQSQYSGTNYLAVNNLER